MAFEGKSSEKAFPPLPRWPAEVYPDEAAHGFFQRLTLENGQVSVRTLATNLGLNGRNIVPESFLELVMRFPSRNREELASATAKLRGAMVAVRGQLLRFPRDWSTRRMRICPGCLGERRYHRFWFDLNVLSTCPIHSCQLVETVGDHRLTWWYPEVGVAPETGQSASRTMPRIEAKESFERYMLGRLGVMPHWSIPFLDPVELFQIVDVAQVLGRMKQYGWSISIPRSPQRNTLAWREQIAAGFDVLKCGPTCIRELLDTYSKGCDIDLSDCRLRNIINKYWGWIYFKALSLDNSILKDYILETIQNISIERGVYSRSNAFVQTRSAETMNLRTLAEKLGIGRRFLRRVTDKIGLSPKKCPRGQVICFNERECQQIEEVLSDLMNKKAAASMLKLRWIGFEKFCLTYRLIAFLPAKSCGTSYYRKSEILQIIGHLERDVQT